MDSRVNFNIPHSLFKFWFLAFIKQIKILKFLTLRYILEIKKYIIKRLGQNQNELHIQKNKKTINAFFVDTKNV